MLNKDAATKPPVMKNVVKNKKFLAVFTATMVLVLAVFFVKIPTTALVTYTEQEPYVVEEVVEEQEPYIEEVCTKRDVLYLIDGVRCRPASAWDNPEITVVVKNLDDTRGGNFTLWVGFIVSGIEQGEEVTKYIGNGSSAEFSYEFDRPIDTCTYRIVSVPTKKAKCSMVTKYRTVINYVNVTKCRDVEANRTETIFKTISEILGFG